MPGDTLALPFHYRDNGQPCDYSNTGDMSKGCFHGCSGARFHYANDGHEECDDARIDNSLYEDYAAPLSDEEPEAADENCAVCGCGDSNANYLRYHLKAHVWHCEDCIETAPEFSEQP